MKKYFFSTYYEYGYIGLAYDTASEMVEFLQLYPTVIRHWKEHIIGEIQQLLSTHNYAESQTLFSLMIDVLRCMDEHAVDGKNGVHVGTNGASAKP